MLLLVSILFFFNDTATTEIYTYLHTLSLHDALPISLEMGQADAREGRLRHEDDRDGGLSGMTETVETTENAARPIPAYIPMPDHPIRHTRWWQMFVDLPRPALEWGTVGENERESCWVRVWE